MRHLVVRYTLTPSVAALTAAVTSVTVTVTGACDDTDYLALFCFDGALTPQAGLVFAVMAVAGAAPRDTNLSFPFKFKRVRALQLCVPLRYFALIVASCAGRGCAAAAGGDF